MFEKLKKNSLIKNGLQNLMERDSVKNNIQNYLKTY